MGNSYGENLTNIFELVTDEALKEVKKEDSKMANHLERMKELAEIEKTLAEVRLSDAKAFKEAEEMRLKEAEIKVAKRNSVINGISKIGGLGLGAGSFWLLLKQEVTGSFHTKGLSWFTEWWRMSK